MNKNEISPTPLYAVPGEVPDFNECSFYHTIELPGRGVIEGSWDLRPEIHDYLGRNDFNGRRVLEIGPATGYVTFEMERRGARVVSVEVPDDPGWDFVPFPPDVLTPAVLSLRRIGMRRVKNAYWFCRAAIKSQARIFYGDVYNLPAALGKFDVAVIACVLMHCRDPLRIIEQCAQRSSSLIIAEMLHPELEGSPVCRLHPTAANKDWDTWWNFSSDFFLQFLSVMGFTRFTKHTSIHVHEKLRSYSMFTITASRE